MNKTSNSFYNSSKNPDILVVCRTFSPKEGGIEDYIYNRCLQEPDRVIVLAADCPGSAHFDREQNFLVHRWPSPVFLKTIFLGSLIKQLLFLLFSLFLTIKLFFRYRYKFVEWGHGYDFLSLLLVSYLLPVKCFMYLHGNDLLCPLRNPVLRSLFGWTLNRMTGIICNSKFTESYLRDKFYFSVPTCVVNPTVRVGKFTQSLTPEYVSSQRQFVLGKYEIPQDSIVILSVGRLVPRKGFHKVIESIPHLVKSGINVHYLICGRGPSEKSLRRLAVDTGVEDRVHFAGFVPEDALHSIYAACDIFSMITFFNSQSASIEGFGIVYLEAGHFAKPVIAAKVGGVVDAVQHEVTGILVDPNSQEEILDALLRLCKDSELRISLGQGGQILARKKQEVATKILNY